MKRIFWVIIFVFMLSSCKPEDEGALQYEETDFVFEVNQENLDLNDYFESENTLLINDHGVEYGEIGEYTLFVTDTVTEDRYEIAVSIVDTIAPEIIVPEDFQQYYDLDAVLDLSEIVVTDNSLEEISYTTNLHEIDMSIVGTYSLVITAQDSTGNLKVTSLEINVRFVNYPMIEIRTSNISNTSFSIEFVEDDIDGYKVSSSYKVSQDDTVVQQGELTDTFSFNLSGLLQNTDYYIDMEFVYLIPGEEQETITSRVLVTTLDLFVPFVELDELLITNDVLSFVVDAIDPDDLLEDLSVTVRDQDQVLLVYRFIETEPLVSLEDLNFGQEYHITISYSYDLADGNGLQDFTDEYTYQLIEKNVPIFNIGTSVSYNDISVTVGVLDSDLALESLLIEVYDDDTLVASMNPSASGDEFEVTLGGETKYDATYQVVITASYEVVMGVIEEVILHDQPIVVELMPVVSFESVFNVLLPGDDIRIEMEFDNPNNNHIGGVQINGVYYGDDRIDVLDGVYTFSIDGTDVIGTYQIILEKIYYNNYDVTYTGIETEVDVRAPLPILLYEPSDFNVEIGQDTEITISVENTMALSIYSVTINGIEYSGEDINVNAEQTTISVLLTGCGAVCNIEFYLDSITYNFNELETFVGLYENVTLFVHYADEAPSAINTRQDLIDICSDPDGSYYLNVDIDLSGLDWDPLVCVFTGYLNGNNHSITNMTITSTFRDSGLFEEIGATGFVTDVFLTDVLVNITDSNNTQYGTLAGVANGHVQNIIVTGVIFLYDLDAILGDAYIGGLVGSSLNGTFNDVVVTVDFEVDNSIPDVRVGGIFGNLVNGTVYKAHFQGSINVTEVPNSNVGGIAGRMLSSNAQIVSTDVFIHVDVSVTSSVGGIVGYVSGSTIRDFSAIEEIIVNDDTENANAGGVAGYSTSTEFDVGYAYGSVWRVFLFTSTQYIAGISGYSNADDSFSDIIVLVEMNYQSIIETDAYNECIAGYITASNSTYSSASLFIADRAFIGTGLFGSNTFLVVRADTAFDILLTDQNPSFFEEYVDFDLKVWDGWDETRDVPLFTWYE